MIILLNAATELRIAQVNRILYTERSPWYGQARWKWAIWQNFQHSTFLSLITPPVPGLPWLFGVVLLFCFLKSQPLAFTHSYLFRFELGPRAPFSLVCLIFTISTLCVAVVPVGSHPVPSFLSAVNKIWTGARFFVYSISASGEYLIWNVPIDKRIELTGGLT